jgi:hypothetical protein
MAKPQHTSKGISLARQREIATIICQSFINENARFKAFDPELDLIYADKVKAKIEETDNISPDYVMVSLQMRASKKVMDLSAAAYTNIRAIKYYVEKAFANNYIQLYEFGYPELKDVLNSHTKLLLFLKSFLITLDSYKSDLITKGLSQQTINETIQLTQELDIALVDQKQAKKARFATTGKRVKAYNELWELIGNIAKAGKLIFEKEPDYQRDYILDTSPKKKTMKLAGKEVEAATMKGIITDKETSKPIEDAMIEIVGTNFNATTDEKGNFILEEVIPGNYTIKIMALGYNELEKTGIKLDSENDKQEFAFTLEKLIWETS